MEVFIVFPFTYLQVGKTKKRWKKKIGGEEYVTDEEEDPDETPAPQTTEGATASMASMSLTKQAGPSMEYVQNDFRRRKCSDLKSVSERKAEMAQHELLMRDYL